MVRQAGERSSQAPLRAVVVALALVLGISSLSTAQAARPWVGPWSGYGVVFKVGRDKRGLRVARFRSTYTMSCQTPASGGRRHRVAHMSFRIGPKGRFAGRRRFALRGSNRSFTARVTGQFTGRRHARGVITWLFPGCRPTPRRWNATGPLFNIEDDGGGGGGGGGGVCIWIPLPDGSGSICV
jgi:hypothetical protein